MSGRRPWQHKAIEDSPELSKRVGDRRFDPPEPKEEADEDRTSETSPSQ